MIRGPMFAFFDDVIFILCHFYLSLRTFEIFGCFNVSAGAIKRLGQKCSNMETLNLGQCHKVWKIISD